MKNNILQKLFLVNVIFLTSFISAYSTVAQDDSIEHNADKRFTAQQINQVIGDMVHDAVSRAMEERHVQGTSMENLQQLLLVVREQGADALSAQEHKSVVSGLTTMYREIIMQKEDGHTLLDRSFQRIFYLFNFSVDLMRVAVTVFVATVTWRLISALTGYTISGIIYQASGLGLLVSVVQSIFGVTNKVVKDSACTSYAMPSATTQGFLGQCGSLFKNGVWALGTLSNIMWSVALVKNYSRWFIPA